MRIKALIVFDSMNHSNMRTIKWGNTLLGLIVKGPL